MFDGEMEGGKMRLGWSGRNWILSYFLFFPLLTLYLSRSLLISFSVYIKKIII
jgi:hypothetical protein